MFPTAAVAAVGGLKHTSGVRKRGRTEISSVSFSGVSRTVRSSLQNPADSGIRPRGATWVIQGVVTRESDTERDFSPSFRKKRASHPVWTVAPGSMAGFFPWPLSSCRSCLKLSALCPADLSASLLEHASRNAWALDITLY